MCLHRALQQSAAPRAGHSLPVPRALVAPPACQHDPHLCTCQLQGRPAQSLHRHEPVNVTSSSGTLQGTAHSTAVTWEKQAEGPGPGPAAYHHSFHAQWLIRARTGSKYAPAEASISEARTPDLGARVPRGQALCVVLGKHTCIYIYLYISISIYIYPYICYPIHIYIHLWLGKGFVAEFGYNIYTYMYCIFVHLWPCWRISPCGIC